LFRESFFYQIGGILAKTPFLKKNIRLDEKNENLGDLILDN